MTIKLPTRRHDWDDRDLRRPEAGVWRQYLQGMLVDEQSSTDQVALDWQRGFVIVYTGYPEDMSGQGSTDAPVRQMIYSSRVEGVVHNQDQQVWVIVADASWV